MAIAILQTELNQPVSFIKDQFYNDVIAGLSANPKQLSSKYFYDANGDKLFQEIGRAHV